MSDSTIRSPYPVVAGAAAARRQLLAALWAGWTCAAAGPALAAVRHRPLDIPLALEAPADIDPKGWLVSEKYDGVRAVWDGRQLRFRSGPQIHAPDAFLAGLPGFALDGELWLARGRFEALVAAVRRKRPDAREWQAVRYMVFDAPEVSGTFETRQRELSRRLAAHGGPALQAVTQERVADRSALARRLDEVVGAGGEGLILHRADAPYAPGRDGSLLKLKPVADAEATVVGYEAGQGRLLGQMGALRVRTDQGVGFSIGTGFDAALRRTPPAIGQRITFSYRGLTADGVPRFASYLRRRPDGI